MSAFEINLHNIALIIRRHGFPAEVNQQHTAVVATMIGKQNGQAIRETREIKSMRSARLFLGY